MQRQNNDIDRLLNIKEFASLILDQLNGLSEDEFNSNEVLRWALLKWMENIGEAVNQLTNETREEFDQLDWRSIISARHFYVHHYFNIRWTRIWKSLQAIDFMEIKEYAGKTANILKERYLL